MTSFSTAGAFWLQRMEAGTGDRSRCLQATHLGWELKATSDGGRTWREVRTKLPAGIYALHDLWLFPGGKGWATGSDAVRGGSLYVLATADGGTTWSLSPVPNL